MNEAHLAPVQLHHGNTLIAGGPRTRRECWGATSRDGRWDFERMEEPGTPWQLIHKATDQVVTRAGNLRTLRALVGSGRAYDMLVDQLERDIEEQRIWGRGDVPSGTWFRPSQDAEHTRQWAAQCIAVLVGYLATVRAEMETQTS